VPEITIDTRDLVSVKDTASILNCHRYQIYRWVNGKKLIGVKLGGVLFIPRTEVERLQNWREKK